MTCRIGEGAPKSGIYWCTVCKRPDTFTEGQVFPECKNLCGRCHWEFVESLGTGPAA